MTTDIPAVHDKVAIAALWGGVRIVVIDIETTTTPEDGTLRAVSFATVNCRAGTVRGKWQTLVNPGVPVDRESRRYHGITDEHLDGEPMFADVAGTLLAELRPADGETVVVAGHNIGFDIAVLRTELGLVGRDLPDLPIIDTMGKLPALAGVQPTGKGLPALLETLGMVNSRPHDAMADATACADALVALLARAASAGHTDFDELLNEVSGTSTTHSVKARARITDRVAKAPTLPSAHLDTHTDVLSARAGKQMLAAWRNNIADCAALRCSHLEDRVTQARIHPQARIAQLEQVLADVAASGDTAGAATIVGAMLPYFDFLTTAQDHTARSNAVRAWAKKWGPRLDPLGRCEVDDRCPACRDHRPCPLDEWPAEIARVALGDHAGTFVVTAGKNAGTGPFLTWQRAGVDPRIIGAAVASCIDHWRAEGHDDKAGQVALLAWSAGCRHPDVVDVYAGKIAAPGRQRDLARAIKACEQALPTQDGSTSEGWTRLQSRRNQLAGRAQRLAFRHSGTYDADGNPIPVRRHHPSQPRRTRPARFVGP